MEQTWSLTELYDSFESPKLQQDMMEMKKGVEAYKEWAREQLPAEGSPVSKLEHYIQFKNEFERYSLLYDYAELSLSVDAENETALRTLDELEDVFAELSGPDALFVKYVAEVADLDGLINSSELLQAHRFALMELKDESRYVLMETEELIISKLQNTGSGAWGKLTEQLTSTLMVPIERQGKIEKLPLPAIRNMAYEDDPEIRKAAYHAELAAYETVDKSVAASLNGIKGEVIALANLRGYDSPLAMTLREARMERRSLDAMMTAIRKYLPVFTRYFQKKASMLGHGDRLPFYDLFAPVGKVDMRFTYEEAADFVVHNFTAFSKKMGDYARRAFDSRWIDAPPREGKRGGAFCDNLHAIGESRILTNFTGSFSDMQTLAHELGHGYHGDCLNPETALNSGYTMPIAETASTFCETIVTKAALKTASEAEAVVILENDLSGVAQVIVDIYSRFLFEDEVFARRKNGSLSVRELKEIMLDSQKKAYGDGLDERFLHPYMWLCKPHYYYADANYYNFPYAYGMLFAKGLYGLYLRDGDSFVAGYDKLLASTGKNNLRDVGLQVGIDINDTEFWESSLQIVEEDIKTFCGISL